MMQHRTENRKRRQRETGNREQETRIVNKYGRNRKQKAWRQETGNRKKHKGGNHRKPLENLCFLYFPLPCCFLFPVSCIHAFCFLFLPPLFTILVSCSLFPVSRCLRVLFSVLCRTIEKALFLKVTFPRWRHRKQSLFKKYISSRWWPRKR